jgi:glycosyltransferase involved in cell wall biosynthesis
MDKPALVSSIIIFYNGEKFLEEAIDSIFKQTRPDWELLLVDDGSTDGSTAIAQRIAETYPTRVKYLEHPGHTNRGMSASRNLGIRHARGNYVAFLDADDVWLPQKLEHQIPLLEAHPEAAMLYGRTELWWSWSGKPSDIHRDRLTKPPPVPPNSLVRPPHLLASFLENEFIYPCTCSILIRREVFEKIGQFEESFRSAYEDMVFHSKVFLNAPVLVVSGCWDKYRQHPNKSWAVAERNGQYNRSWPNVTRRAYLDWLVAYIQKNQLDSPELRRALQSVLWAYQHPVSSALKKARHATTRAIKGVARKALPAPLHDHVRQHLKGPKMHPPIGRVRFGHLRRLTPISQQFGFDRGVPVDRYYIERFLASHSSRIAGRVLEIADPTYTRRFGGTRVTQADVLHLVGGNREATIVGDLACANHIPSEAFDCIILTQTLHLIFDVRAAVRTLHRILKPGGALLATFPGISQLSHHDVEDRELWYWSFTTKSARRLFDEFFVDPAALIQSHGNVLAATAFLHGLAKEELTEEELNCHDPDFEVLITVLAQRGPLSDETPQGR